MEKLMFISTDIEDVEKIDDIAKSFNIAEESINVINRNEAEVSSHHLHSANYLQRLDILHSGEWGALSGLVLGVLFSAALNIFKPYGFQLDYLTLAGIIALITFFGTWVGGMVGISHENHKISKFNNEIKKGKTLTMIDIEDECEQSLIEKILQSCPKTRFTGKDLVGENIFDDLPFWEGLHSK